MPQIKGSAVINHHVAQHHAAAHILLHTQFRSVQSLSPVRLFVIPWTTARQASLSITNSRSPPKPMSIEAVMPSNHLILCRLISSHLNLFSIRVFSNESALHIRWPKYWSFSFRMLCILFYIFHPVLSPVSLSVENNSIHSYYRQFSCHLRISSE